MATVPAGYSIFSLVLPLLSSLQIGSLVTWGLQGILCVQVYNYYLSFPRDPLHMKVLVYCTFTIEVAQTGMVTHDAYKVFAVGFGDLIKLDDLHLLWLTLPILGGVVGLCCHLTFAYRISLLSGSKLVGCVISALSVCASVAAFVFGGKLCSARVFSKALLVKHIYLTCGIWHGAGALSDLVIAGCMFHFLSRSQTGFHNTDVLITRIVRLSIETGIITASASIASAVLFIGFRDKMTIMVYFIIPAIMITKLYAITILATFNNRPHAIGGPPPLPESENCFDSSTKMSSRNLERMTGTEIRIGRSVVKQVWSDGMPVEHLEMYGGERNSIRDDEESSTQKVSESLTCPDDGLQKL